MISFIFLMTMLIMVGAFTLGNKVTPRSVKTTKPSSSAIQAGRAGAKQPVTTRSQAANVIIEAYLSIPEDNRPFVDVVPLVEALDNKHEIDYVNTHFQSFKTYGTLCVSTCPSRSRQYDDKQKKKCPLAEYTELYDAIRSIKRAMEDRERALQRKQRDDELKSLEPTLAEVKELTATLKAEAGIIRQVTQEVL